MASFASLTAAAAATLVVLCPMSQAAALTPRLSAADRAAAFEVAGYTAQGFAWTPCRDIHLPTGWISSGDLNGDGQPEAWIRQANPHCYNGKGEAFAVLTKRGGQWVVVLGVPGSPLALFSRTGGWRDIRVTPPEGGRGVVYRFNGLRYVLGHPRTQAPRPVHVQGGPTDGFLYGGPMNDVLTAGVANDMLIGGAGDDLYVWRRGNGDLVIQDNAGDANDVLRLGAVSSADVAVRAEGGDVVLIVAPTPIGPGGQITLHDLLVPGARARVGVDTVRFDDGALWTADEIRRRASPP